MNVGGYKCQFEQLESMDMHMLLIRVKTNRDIWDNNDCSCWSLFVVASILHQKKSRSPSEALLWLPSAEKLWKGGRDYVFWKVRPRPSEGIQSFSGSDGSSGGRDNTCPQVQNVVRKGMQKVKEKVHHTEEGHTEVIL